MPVRFFYVDESHDDEKYCLIALGIRHCVWNEQLTQVKKWRESLWEKFSVFRSAELHAVKLTRGKGRPSNRFLSPVERIRIFEDGLKLVGNLPQASLISVAIPKRGTRHPYLKAWDRLVNRIETNCRKMDEKELDLRLSLSELATNRFNDNDRAESLRKRLLKYQSRAVIVADNGHETQIRRSIRRMHVHNYIPTRYAAWDDGTAARNLTVKRIIEDPVFRDSRDSYFIQLADFVAYALLKSEVRGTTTVEKYGIDGMFERYLKGICVKEASSNDPRGLGIVRN